jgi:heme-degrading monooxygenase HmoA
MSVIVTVRIPGDTDQFRNWIATDIDNIVAISQGGKDAGAIHHQFAIGDGEILVVDEWDTAEHFEAFFAQPEIAEAMAAGGAQGPPAISVYEAVDSADRF